MNPYQKIKKEITHIASETVSMGNSTSGGFSRAEDEYWIEPLSINSFGPSYLVKFQAAIAIIKLQKDSGLAENIELKEIAMYLLGKLSNSEIESMEESQKKDLISDSMDIFDFNWQIVHSVLKKNA